MNLDQNPVIKFSRKGKGFAEYRALQVPEVLRQRKVQSTDHFWLAGMSEWKPVSELLPMLEQLAARAVEEDRKRRVALTLAERKGDGMLIITTAPIVQGYRIKEYLGMTRGIMVRTPNILESYSAAAGMLLGGGKISALKEMCEKTRQEAYQAMILDARDMGANAIIGVSYNSNDVIDSCTEVLCYGTAVVVVQD